MADVRLLFPADYLSAAWLKERDVTFTISGVQRDELKTEKGSEKCPVIRFAELDAKRAKDEDDVPFKWVLNKTNANTIASLYGYETDEWIGKRVTLYPTTCVAWKKTVDCIRVRPKVPAPKGTKKQPEPAPAPASADDFEPDDFEETGT
jgi:hypothetical protein